MTATTPAPWRTERREDGVRIIVGPDTDNGAPHTVCEVRVCDDGTHPRRSIADAELIVEAVNALPGLLALAGTCGCYDGNPDNYEGQRADCPVHGSVRAYAEASAEVERLRAQLDRARTAVHRYFGHAGEVEACTVGICHSIVHPDAPNEGAADAALDVVPDLRTGDLLVPPVDQVGALACGPGEISEDQR